MNEILHGDSLEMLKALHDGIVQCVVTSPPYWGLRDYQTEGQLGLEKTPEEYVGKLVAVFHEVRRVLRDDGVVFLNLGDSYTSGNRPDRDPGLISKTGIPHRSSGMERAKTPAGLKPKDLVGIPWKCAFALQADGWWLRQDIIWHKPNPMPESVTDRCTKAHEYVFLLTKASKYYWDAEAIKEPSVDPDDNRKARQKPEDYNTMMSETGQLRAVINPANAKTYPMRNRRSVWTIATQPSSEPHFAQFPEKLVEPCVLAGTSEKGGCPACGEGWERITESDGWQPVCSCGTEEPIPSKELAADETLLDDFQIKPFDPVPCVVLDPFCGLGTACIVAKKLGRAYIGIDISEKYAGRAREKLAETGYQMPLFNQCQ